MPEVRFMVAHDTGNPSSTAEGNVGYYQNSRNQISASAHIFVDDNSIVECVPFLTGTPEKAWHVLYNVTKDNAMYGDDANDTAGGVEMCYGPGINSAESYKRFVWVLAYSCYKFKLNPAKAIVGHKILDPGRKIDPHNGLKYMGKTYEQLLKDVVAEYNDCLGVKTAKPATTISGTVYEIEKGDTFWSIAQDSKGSFTVQDLIAWNPTVNAAALKVGTKINLKKPAKTEAKKATSESKKPAATKKKVNLPSGVLKSGDKGSDVLALQEALCSIYFYPEKGTKDNGCDSYFGGKTENALTRFQLTYLGVKEADGKYGPKTKAKLEDLLN